MNAMSNIGKQLDRKIVPVLQEQSIGRHLIPKNTELSGRGIGNTSVTGFEYKEMASAVTEYQILQTFEDRPDIRSTTIKIPIQQDMATIKRREFESMKMQGFSVDADVSFQMAMNVTHELDKTVVQGWNGGDIKGCFQVAGAAHAGFDFGEYRGAIKTVAEGIKLLHANKVYSQGYNLVIHPYEYMKLLISETDYGMEELPKVMTLLNENAQGDVARVYSCEHLDPGTGFMLPVAIPQNQVYFDLIEAQEPKHYFSYAGGMHEDIADINIHLMGAAVPRFKHLDANGLSPCVVKFTELAG